MQHCTVLVHLASNISLYWCILLYLLHFYQGQWYWPTHFSKKDCWLSAYFRKHYICIDLTLNRLWLRSVHIQFAMKNFCSFCQSKENLWIACIHRQSCRWQAEESSRFWKSNPSEVRTKKSLIFLCSHLWLMSLHAFFCLITQTIFAFYALK